MKRRDFLGLLFGPPLAALAQQETLTLDGLVQSGEEWLRQNIDPRVLRNLDLDQARRYVRMFQEQFQGEYVIDLAALRDTAKAVLPLLRANAATRPYAAWLEPRMDYFEVADELRLLVPPPPKPPPGQPPKPTPNPPPELERKTWQKQVQKRPLPKGAATYVPKLKPVFASHRVAQELVWLAEVESSFNPEAHSPAGAAGLYQLMPATAKSLGLSLQPKDERLDPEKSAGAAARYLKYLHGKFKDWRLTLAAYNTGEGRVQTLLKKHKARSFDEIAPRLPAETQMYVPKFEAVLQRREGIPIAKLAAPDQPKKSG